MALALLTYKQEKGSHETKHGPHRLRRRWLGAFASPRRRYDGHPDLDLLDIGSVGLWGEWHMSGTEVVTTGKPVPLPSLELRLALIEAWCNAFPKTSKVILIGSEEGMAQALKTGYGWRADCLSDMGGCADLNAIRA